MSGIDEFDRLNANEPIANMTKREYFALMSLVAIRGNPNHAGQVFHGSAALLKSDSAAAIACADADALLIELAKG